MGGWGGGRLLAPSTGLPEAPPAPGSRLGARRGQGRWGTVPGYLSVGSGRSWDVQNDSACFCLFVCLIRFLPSCRITEKGRRRERDTHQPHTHTPDGGLSPGTHRPGPRLGSDGWRLAHRAMLTSSHGLTSEPEAASPGTATTESTGRRRRGHRVWRAATAP